MTKQNVKVCINGEIVEMTEKEYAELFTIEDESAVEE